MTKINLFEKIAGIILLFIISFFLFQALEEFISSLDNLPLKELFLLLIPGPEDSILEFLQFMLYWGGIGYLTFKKK